MHTELGSLRPRHLLLDHDLLGEAVAPAAEVARPVGNEVAAGPQGAHPPAMEADELVGGRAGELRLPVGWHVLGQPRANLRPEGGELGCLVGPQAAHTTAPFPEVRLHGRGGVPIPPVASDRILCIL